MLECLFLDLFNGGIWVLGKGFVYSLSINFYNINIIVLYVIFYWKI